MAAQPNSSQDEQHQPLILIVEDDAAISGVISDFLDALGYQTATASDGEEAVAATQRLKPDLIVMDLMMPRLTGGEAASALKLDLPTARIPILGISALDNVEDIAELLPIDAVLEKPFDLSDLQREVERLLAGVPALTEGDSHPQP
jgi:CheY-like chemotaxis protein